MGSFGCCFCYGVGGSMQKLFERFTTTKIKPFDASADAFPLSYTRVHWSDHKWLDITSVVGFLAGLSVFVAILDAVIVTSFCSLGLY